MPSSVIGTKVPRREEDGVESLCDDEVEDEVEEEEEEDDVEDASTPGLGKGG